MSKKLTTAAIGGAFAVTLVSGTAIATENPFELNAMDSGYLIGMSSLEGSCGEGKCGEGKCGEKTEAKCGEGKCGAK